MRAASLALIRVYQYTLGPVLGLFSRCRYEPTCSRYGQEAITRFGPRRGWSLALRRIGRCNPFGGYGWDPVPEEYPTRAIRRALRAARRAPHTDSHDASATHGDPA